MTPLIISGHYTGTRQQHSRAQRDEAGAPQWATPASRPRRRKSVSRPAADRRQSGDRVPVPHAPTNPHGSLKDEDRPGDANDVGNPVRDETEGREREQHVGRELQDRGTRKANELQQHRHEEGACPLRCQR